MTRAVVAHAAKDLRIENRSVGEMGRDQAEISIGAGGICGSDLHYYNDGGIGAIRLQEPMVLGHEVAGTVTAVGSDVSTVKVGDLVAVNPSRPCGKCAYCQRGQQNHCLDMRFYGSAMRMPHVHGAFQQTLIADAGQCVVAPPSVSANKLAFAEPFAVTLHGVGRAGPLIGKRVLVTGSGPIGALAVLAARTHGAREIVATDVVDQPLVKAREMGADRTINVASDGDALAAYGVDKGSFDVVLEASGNQAALQGALEVLRPRGVLVQLGLGGDITIPQNTIVAKEIELRGSFRFHEEFELAVELIASGRVDVMPLLTDVFDIERVVHAFELANDRTRAMKVQLSF
ncbi:MAG: L-idonate 5-dehydrogenase [Pseudomonadota bacterium]